MGNSFEKTFKCCISPESRLDEFFTSLIYNLELKNLSHNQVRTILYKSDDKINTLLNQNKSKGLSDKSLRALEHSLNKISNEGFTNLAAEHFYFDIEHGNQMYEYHRLLFSQMYTSHSLNKDEILLTLLSLMRDDTSEKAKIFCEMFKGETFEYLKFKEKLFYYLEFNLLTLPCIFLKDADNIVESEVKEQLSLYSNEDQNENLKKFMQRIFTSWEEQNHHNLEDYSNLKGVVISKEDAMEILLNHEYIFDYWGLKRRYDLMETKKFKGYYENQSSFDVK